MDKLQKVLNEVERLQNELITEKKNGYSSDVDDACILELQNIKNYIKFVQKEPVSEDIKEAQKNIWHSLDEKPSFPISNDELSCSILVLYNNGNMFLYRYGKNGIPNDIATPHFYNIMDAKWCYCEDIIPKGK